MRVPWHNIGSKYSSVGLTQAKKYLLKVCFATNEFFHTGRWEEQFLSECINLSKCQKTQTHHCRFTYYVLISPVSIHSISCSIYQGYCSFSVIVMAWKKRDLPYTTSGNFRFNEPNQSFIFHVTWVLAFKTFHSISFPMIKKNNTAAGTKEKKTSQSAEEIKLGIAKAKQ